MGKHHRKINNRFRVNYVKNEAKKEKEKDYKKVLRKWLLLHCQDDRAFYGRVIVRLSRNKDYKSMAALISEEWLQHDRSIRPAHTAFMDNAQYMGSLVETLERELRVEGEESAGKESESAYDSNGESIVTGSDDEGGSEEVGANEGSCEEMPRKKQKVV